MPHLLQPLPLGGQGDGGAGVSDLRLFIVIVGGIMAGWWAIPIVLTVVL